jgi:hypothetical protein
MAFGCAWSEIQAQRKQPLRCSPTLDVISDQHSDTKSLVLQPELRVHTTKGLQSQSPLSNEGLTSPRRQGGKAKATRQGRQRRRGQGEQWRKEGRLTQVALAASLTFGGGCAGLIQFKNQILSMEDKTEVCRQHYVVAQKVQLWLWEEEEEEGADHLQPGTCSQEGLDIGPS